jgi:hypothetical protein
MRNRVRNRHDRESQETWRCVWAPPGFSERLKTVTPGRIAVLPCDLVPAHQTQECRKPHPINTPNNRPLSSTSVNSTPDTFPQLSTARIVIPVTNNLY